MLRHLGRCTRPSLFCWNWHRSKCLTDSASRLAEPLGISLAAVVQHLQILEQSGLVHTGKVGRMRICRMEPSGLLAVESWIDRQRSFWESRLDRLGDLLDEA